MGQGDPCSQHQAGVMRCKRKFRRGCPHRHHPLAQRIVLVVHPSVPAKTVPEFLSYAKADPDKITMAAAGIRITDHVCGELFKMMTGINIVHVPYRGGGASLYADLLSGQVQVSFPVMPSAIGYI